jgi:hypothetical protein
MYSVQFYIKGPIRYQHYSVICLSSLDLEIKQFYYVDPTNNVVKFNYSSYTQVDTWGNLGGVTFMALIIPALFDVNFFS